MVDMFERLNDLRFVNGLVVEGTVLPGQALPDIIFAGNASKPCPDFHAFPAFLPWKHLQAHQSHLFLPRPLPPYRRAIRYRRTTFTTLQMPALNLTRQYRVMAVWTQVCLPRCRLQTMWVLK